MKKKILIISIYYPPIQSIASNRIESFSKYLNKSKYNVYVHTLGNNNSIDIINDTTINRVKNNILFKPFIFQKRTNKIVHYTKVVYNKLVKLLFSNEYRGWIKNSLDTLPDFIKDNKIDLILSTYAPTAPHLVALELKKQFPKIIWITDMRDELSQGLNLSSGQLKRYRQLERDIFNNADALISVSKPIVEEFKLMCPNKRIIFKEIRNGYDFSLKSIIMNNKVFTITYLGNFYGDINPISFLTSLSNLINKNIHKNIKVQFVGVKTHFNIPNNLKKIIEIIPTVSHEKAIEIMHRSDLLLMIHPTNGRKGVYTGKLFEYLGSLTPILALVDEEDVAAELIKNANAGFISDNNNLEKIETLLLGLYKAWASNDERVFNRKIVMQHHRKEQVKRLEKLIEELLGE